MPLFGRCGSALRQPSVGLPNLKQGSVNRRSNPQRAIGLHGRYDKIDLPLVCPMVTRVERYAGHCPCCGGVTLAAIPTGLEDGSPFSVNIVAFLPAHSHLALAWAKMGGIRKLHRSRHRSSRASICHNHIDLRDRERRARSYCSVWAWL